MLDQTSHLAVSRMLADELIAQQKFAELRHALGFVNIGQQFRDGASDRNTVGRHRSAAHGNSSVSSSAPSSTAKSASTLLPGAGCGAACGVVLGGEKFTLGTGETPRSPQSKLRWV